jgi:hypothetical protein
VSSQTSSQALWVLDGVLPTQKKNIPSGSEVKEEKRREDIGKLFLYAATATATNHVTTSIIRANLFLSRTFFGFAERNAPRVYVSPSHGLGFNQVNT